jgi:hypothetical protein
MFGIIMMFCLVKTEQNIVHFALSCKYAVKKIFIVIQD